MLLPSYNSGSNLLPTLRAALRFWPDVWVVIDGSTDASARESLKLAATHPGLRVIVRPENGGKGSAVLEGMRQALGTGFTHALVMDADGQHPADRIPQFMQLAENHSDTLILGVPQFGPEAPKSRIYGRKAGNAFTALETLWGGIDDSLFGFRVYPIEATVRLMNEISSARGYDFDTEIAVRLYWQGFRTINVPVPVRYPSKDQGGCSYFHYVRDNLLLVRTHTTLLLGMIPRLNDLIGWRLSRRPIPVGETAPSSWS